MEAYELVLGRHWRQCKKGRELVILMRHCADIDPDATRPAVVHRRYGQLPYAAADNILAAMLARLRTLAGDLRGRCSRDARSALVARPQVEADLVR